MLDFRIENLPQLLLDISLACVEMANGAVDSFIDWERILRVLFADHNASGVFPDIDTYIAAWYHVFQSLGGEMHGISTQSPRSYMRQHALPIDCKRYRMARKTYRFYLHPRDESTADAALHLALKPYYQRNVAMGWLFHSWLIA